MRYLELLEVCSWICGATKASGTIWI